MIKIRNFDFENGSTETVCFVDPRLPLINRQTEKLNFDTNYTGCIKKKVIELQRTIIRELLGV